ncbi:DUF6088 family protein [Obesumbacterium proteus]|uniref:DUF6088 family protein n=1 Tax=Obesumbacterium proteus TaxID=82983 RepID=UPI002430BDA7|nr:DUF6088 family protein [Obesumbacterium proteus]
MSIQSQVAKDIERFQPGTLFSYQELPTYQTTLSNVAKALSRLVQAGKLRRFAKGRFYRPKQGLLGEQRPSDDEKLRALLFSGQQRTGYITGMSLYNRMGLTTQLPKTITIATQGARQTKDLRTLKVKIVPARVVVTEQNRVLLEMLDALNDIKAIPDTTPSAILSTLYSKMKMLNDDEIQTLKTLALNSYPPATRALLGMVLEKMGRDESNELSASLNPLSRYNIGLINSSDWPIRAWNIQ